MAYLNPEKSDLSHLLTQQQREVTLNVVFRQISPQKWTKLACKCSKLTSCILKLSRRQPAPEA